jgi:O-antigen/teichoic acid export membrane protein
MVIGDGVLRLALVLIVLGITRDVLAIAWAVALPFFGTLAILWWFIRSGLRGRVRSDVALGRLTANAAQAVAGSLALAILVSGFSLVTVATSGDVSPARLGAFVFAVTVVRAPIMVGVMSAQSLLVITFRDHPAPVRRALVIAGGVLLAGLIAAAVAALIGDPILAAVVGPDFRVGAPTQVVIVVSSALMGALFVTGSLALSRSRHTIYAVGTIAAAVTSVAALLIPVDFSTRTTLALLAAPAVGLLFHAVGIALIPRRG